jgi:imidazolonepropionase-like amidohydrolase
MRFVIVALLAGWGASGPSTAQEEPPPARPPAEMVIQGGRIVTMTGEVLEEGSILIREGKIVEVGEKVEATDGARRLDARRKVVLPGLIDPYTRLGLVQISMVSATVDDDEGIDPSTPQVRALDAFNPLARAVPFARDHGITTALVGPRAGTSATNVIAGQGAVLKLHGQQVESMVLESPASLHVTLGEGPKKRYAERDEAPVSRMGEVAILRSAFAAGKDYADAWSRYEEKRRADPENAEPPDRDLQKEALAAVLSGDLPLFVHCHRADDILAALRVSKEFGIMPVLVHATEGYKVAEEIARAGAPVIVGPVSTIPDRMETLETTPENPSLLARAGVRIALTTAESHLVNHLLYEAGLAVANGLPEEAALRAITLGAAEVLGVADRVGSIEEGKDADLVIFDGDPLEITTHAEWVIIAGEIVYRRGR